MSYRDLDRPPLDARALQAALVEPGRLLDRHRRDVLDRQHQRRPGRGGSRRGGRGHRAHHRPPGGRSRTPRPHAGTHPRRPASPSRCCCVPTEVPAGRWVWLPLLVGLAVAATVEECGVEAGLKWPNDVQVDGRKIAGILLERVDTPDGPAAVVGVGLNVSMRAEELPVDTATSLLLEDATETDRTVVLRQLLRNLEALYRAWRGAGGDPGRRRPRVVPAALRDPRLGRQRRDAGRLDAGGTGRGRRRPRTPRGRRHTRQRR